MKKFLLIAGAVVIAAIVIVAVLLVSNLNGLVAKAIEKGGGEATRTKVSVGGVAISLRDGRGSIKGLEIASPEGYAARTAISLGDIVVDIDVESLRNDPIVLDEVRIQAPVVNAEIAKDGRVNINELRSRVEEYAAKAVTGGGGSGGPQKRIRIQRFVFEQGRVTIDASALGMEKRTIELPEMRLEDVGGSAGAPPGEIAQIVLATFAEKTGDEIAGSGLDRLINEKLGGSAGDRAKDLLKKFGG